MMKPLHLDFSKEPTNKNNVLNNTLLSVYSGRAECLHDVLTFLLKVRSPTVFVVKIQINDEYLTGSDGQPFVIPDKTFQFETNLTLDNLREIANSIEDCHVLAQTLRQCDLKDNSLDRDFKY